MANGWLDQHSNVISDVWGASACVSWKRVRVIGQRERDRDKGETERRERESLLSHISLLSSPISSPSLSIPPLSFLILLCWDDKEREKKWRPLSTAMFFFPACAAPKQTKMRYGNRGGGSFKGFSSPSDETDGQQSSVGEFAPGGDTKNNGRRAHMREGPFAGREMCDRGGKLCVSTLSLSCSPKKRPLLCVPLRGLGSARRCCLGTGEYVIM